MGTIHKPETLKYGLKRSLSVTTKPNDFLQMLSRLAMEYQQKQKELESFLLHMEPHMVNERLSARMEITTNRFRLAQKELLTAILSEEAALPKEKLCHVAMTLCRCFDEMKILFHALAQKSEKPQV